MTAGTNFTIDSHAHVFTSDCALAPSRRYTPTTEAPLEMFMAMLDDHAVTHAVLVQPSFLGTDNSYLVECLDAEPERLRGVAVVSPSIDDSELARLDAAGVVGVRINLFDPGAPERLNGDDWQHLARRAASLGWHVEIHTEGGKVADRLEELLPTGADIVVDHFGRPDPGLGTGDPGFGALTKALRTGRVWVKASAPYRCGGADCADYVRALLGAAGPDRILWGSDWPWTQHADGKSYRACIDWLTDWVPDPAQRQTILGASAAALFGFPLG